MLLLINFLLLIININGSYTNMNQWSIIISSDLHFGNPEIRARKDYQLNKILELKEQENIQIVISAGDLTDDGTDGSKFWGLRSKQNDQLSPLKKEWVEPLQNNDIIPLMTIGNHDSYTGHPYFYKPVFKYVKELHDATHYPWVWMNYSGYYTFEHNGILFISCGKYPKYLKWIKNNLTKDKPMILFYHYNTVEEPFSDWWSDEDKDNFYELIKDYDNILCIINGHFHSSYIKEWRGFKILNGAGTSMLMINMDNDKVKDVKFIKKN